MTILQQLDENQMLNRLNGAGYDDVKNAFFSNYLASLVLLKLQDLKGLMLINDSGNAKLTRFSNNMSDLNFWAKVLFYPADPQIKNRLQHGHAAVLEKESGRVMDSRIQMLMKVPTTAPNAINWNEVVASMLLLKHRYELNSSYFNKIILSIHNWDQLSDSARKKTISDCFMFLMQSDPKSALLARMRELNTGSMLSRTLGDLAMKVIGFKKMMEDGEGGDAGGGATSTGNIGTDGGNAIVGANSGIAPISRPEVGNQPELRLPKSQTKMFKTSTGIQTTRKGKFIFKGNKIIKKRTKKFEPIKFKAPEWMKSAAKAEG